VRVTVRDPDALKSVSPVDLIGYLRGSGWVRQHEIANKASLWANLVELEAEVLIPLLRGASDSAQSFNHPRRWNSGSPIRSRIVFPA
jgi:hypothetical protein